jgi:Nucleotidyl transferase AbiEii toxin, Type IV TA system
MATKAAGGGPLNGNEYVTAAAFRRALQDRLAAAAKSEGVDLQRIRRQVAFDRRLARLFSSTNPPWVLKGGYALELKFAAARTTKDIDLGLDQYRCRGSAARAAGTRAPTRLARFRRNSHGGLPIHLPRRMPRIGAGRFRPSKSI